MEAITFILSFVETNPLIVSFIGGFLFGEEAIIILSALSQQGILYFWNAFLFFMIGSLVMDSFLFLIAGTKAVDWIFKRKIIERPYTKIKFLIDNSSKGRVFIPLLIAIPVP